MSTKKYVRPRIRKGESEFIKALTNSQHLLPPGARPSLTEAQAEEFYNFRKSMESAHENDTDPAASFEAMQELIALRNKEKVFNEFVELTEKKGQFQLFDIISIPEGDERETVAITQMSDQHIDEVVLSDSVMGLNEFNLDIAKARMNTYFVKLVKLIKHHQQNYKINKLIILLEGDVIGGWIHDELAQTNSLSPNEAIYEAKSIIISGFKYIHDNLEVDSINVVAVCGNHTRETRKVQFANFNDTNKEYWMYLDIEASCKMLGLDKIKFYIPKSEMAIITIFGNKYLIAHGHQFKFSGGVGGIFPSMLRWFGNMSKTLGVKAAFIGHWHQSVFTNHVIVNNTVKGYDAFAMGRGLEFSPPSQNLVLLDSEYGFCNFQQIFL